MQTNKPPQAPPRTQAVCCNGVEGEDEFSPRPSEGAVRGRQRGDALEGPRPRSPTAPQQPYHRQ
eukprot:4689265-Pyramimonas_sp.AAC.1